MHFRWSGETLNTLGLEDLKSSEGASPSVFVVLEQLLISCIVHVFQATRVVAYSSSHALSCISSDARRRAFEFISISSDTRGRTFKIICIVMHITRRALSHVYISMHQHAFLTKPKKQKTTICNGMAIVGCMTYAI